MNVKRTAISVALLASFGTSVVIMETASATSLLPDGDYQIVINNTPYIFPPGYQFGSDGAWNSGFTLGCLPGPKGCNSQAMYDNNLTVNGRGGVATDGVAGRINIHVVNGVITGTNLFQVDAIRNTAFANFQQYTASGSAAGMTGAVDAVGSSPEELSKYLERQVATYAEVIRKGKIGLQ